MEDKFVIDLLNRLKCIEICLLHYCSNNEKEKYGKCKIKKKEYNQQCKQNNCKK